MQQAELGCRVNSPVATIRAVTSPTEDSAPTVSVNVGMYIMMRKDSKYTA